MLNYYQEGRLCPAANRLWQKPNGYELRTDARDNHSTQQTALGIRKPRLKYDNINVWFPVLIF